MEGGTGHLSTQTPGPQQPRVALRPGGGQECSVLSWCRPLASVARLLAVCIWIFLESLCTPGVCRHVWQRCADFLSFFFKLQMLRILLAFEPSRVAPISSPHVPLPWRPPFPFKSGRPHSIRFAQLAAPSEQRPVCQLQHSVSINTLGDPSCRPRRETPAGPRWEKSAVGTRLGRTPSPKSPSPVEHGPPCSPLGLWL